MKKIGICLLFLTFFFCGCADKNVIQKVEIYHAGLEIGEKEEDAAFLVLSNSDDIVLFQNMLDGAKKLDGELESINLPYYVEMVYPDRTVKLVFSISDDMSLYFYTEKPKEGYVIDSEDMRAFLLKFEKEMK